MATMMRVYTARALESFRDPSKLLQMDTCLSLNITQRAMCVRIDLQCEWNRNMKSDPYIINGVPVRCFFNSGYIIAYGNSFVSSKRALKKFLELYPLNNCNNVQLRFDYYTTCHQGAFA